MLFAPLEGWRHVEVTDRHTAIDYAHLLRDLSDKHLPNAARIALVQDNLSTHKPASLYEAFPAPEARRLAERFEWHYTPKHGSWLDMAETELSVLSGQCLDRRIPDKQTLAEEIAAWESNRNTNHTKADWQFTTADARVKLKVSVRSAAYGAHGANRSSLRWRGLLLEDSRRRIDRRGGDRHAAPEVDAGAEGDAAGGGRCRGRPRIGCGEAPRGRGKSTL